MLINNLNKLFNEFQLKLCNNKLERGTNFDY